MVELAGPRLPTGEPQAGPFTAGSDDTTLWSSLPNRDGDMKESKTKQQKKKEAGHPAWLHQYLHNQGQQMNTFTVC